jgi:branched-chain amino acid transport system substrate-binding protein
MLEKLGGYIMRAKVFIGLLLAAFVTGLFFVAAPVKAAEPIKIGALLPLADATGKDGSRSMELAVKQINARGGIIGRQLKLIIIDDELKAEKAAAGLDKLCTVDNVDFIVGGMSSGVTMALIPGMKKYSKVVVWAGAAFSGVERAMEGQDWFFHLHAWDYQQGAYYEKGWADLKRRFPNFKRDKMFMAYEEGSFGSGSFKGQKVLAEQNKYEVQGEAFKSAAMGGGDYRAVLRHAKEYKPDQFIWVGYDKDALPIMEQAKEIGFSPLTFIGAPPGWPVDFAKQPLNEGVLLYSYWADAMKNVSKASKAYSDAFHKEFNDTPTTYFGPLLYTNIMILADAIKKAGSTEKAAVIKALEATKYASPLGDTFVFKKSNVIDHQANAWPKFMQWQKGKLEVIWPWKYATAPLIYPFPAWDARGKK